MSNQRIQESEPKRLWAGADTDGTYLTIERRPRDTRLRFETRDGHELLFYLTGDWPTQIALSLLDGKAPTTGGLTCECCGRNMEVRINGKFCNECAGARSKAPTISEALVDAGAVLCQSGIGGAKVEIRFAELRDAQRLHKALVQLKSTPVGKQRCVKCNHNNVDERGVCQETVRFLHRCLCKCQFSVGKEEGEQRECIACAGTGKQLKASDNPQEYMGGTVRCSMCGGSGATTVLQAAAGVDRGETEE